MWTKLKNNTLFISTSIRQKVPETPRLEFVDCGVNERCTHVCSNSCKT